MRITKEIENYVEETIKVSYSNVMITDLERVNLIKFINSSEEYPNNSYMLHENLKVLLEDWRSFQNSKDLLLVNNGDNCIKLIENDKIQYACQIIFPITTKKRNSRTVNTISNSR